MYINNKFNKPSKNKKVIDSIVQNNRTFGNPVQITNTFN